MAGRGGIPGDYEGILGEMWNRGTSGQERRNWGASRRNCYRGTPGRVWWDLQGLLNLGKCRGLGRTQRNNLRVGDRALFPVPLLSLFRTYLQTHCAENLLKADTYRKWRAAKAGEKTISVVLQVILPSPCLLPIGVWRLKVQTLLLSQLAVG